MRGVWSRCRSRGAAYLSWSRDSPPPAWLHAHPLRVPAGGRVASVCRGPGGARLRGSAARRGRAGLTGGSWPLPGAVRLGPGSVSPERSFGDLALWDLAGHARDWLGVEADEHVPPRWGHQRVETNLLVQRQGDGQLREELVPLQARCRAPGQGAGGLRHMSPGQSNRESEVPRSQAERGFTVVLPPLPVRVQVAFLLL